MESTKADNGGVKYDGEKLPMHLIPPELDAAVAAVLGYGAAKYADRNWERGMNWSRPYAALMRHMDAWWTRDDRDDDTGMSHLWHAACNIAMLIAFEARQHGADDRPEDGMQAPTSMFDLAMQEALKRLNESRGAITVERATFQTDGR